MGTTRGKATSGDRTESRARKAKRARESQVEPIEAAEEGEVDRTELARDSEIDQLAREPDLEQIETAQDSEVDRLELAQESVPEQVEATQESQVEQTESGQESDVDQIEPAQIENATAEPELPFENLAQRSRRLSDERVGSILESVLFVADRPLTVNDIRACTGLRPSRIQAGMESLAALRREGEGGTVLYEVAGGWQLRTDPANADYVRRFLRIKPQRLTRAAVETLAIIAYRQPVTRPEIEDIRGVDSGAVVSALLDRKLIKILGRKEEVGRPILYGTTREFLEFFALKDLASLPTLREFQELTDEHRELVEKEGPPSASAVTALDSQEKTAVDELGTESDAALAELDDAIASADERAKAAAAFLAASQAPPEEQEEPPNAP
jgi:segregation and condensation protein B